MTTASNEAAKQRHLSQVAAAAGAAKAHEERRKKTIAERNEAALKAQAAGASYQELGEAAGLTKVGVYKMLERAHGGSLRSSRE